jgi:hypothetical protein
MRWTVIHTYPMKGETMAQGIIANCAARESQVASQAVQLRDALNTLYERLIEFGSRIEPVLRMEPETCGKGTDTPQEYLVPLASDLRNSREVVDSMLTRINSYFNRLEL